jgi:hypothetical protein
VESFADLNHIRSLRGRPPLVHWLQGIDVRAPENNDLGRRLSLVVLAVKAADDLHKDAIQRLIHSTALKANS